MERWRRGLLGLTDLDRDQLEDALELAWQYKGGTLTSRALEGRNLGLMFTVPSTRTRISFQVAARQLGAQADSYSPADLQLSNNESLADTAAVMGRFLDALVVRLYDMKAYGQGRESLELIQRFARRPVINGLDDQEHPCQVLADLLTLRQLFGTDFRRRKVVLTWAYAKRQKSLGVTHSMMVAAALLGMRLTVAFPAGFDPDPRYLSLVRQQAKDSGAEIEVCHDLEEASRGADVIYAKSWMGIQLPVEEELRRREEARQEWRVGERHFSAANPEARFMDCMPLIRGDEADAEVVDGPRSVRYDQAENRLYAQKAILFRVLG